jgi:hypothetical protein
LGVAKIVHEVKGIGVTRQPRRGRFAVLAVALLILSAATAVLGVVVLTSETQAASLLQCADPKDVRCSDDFFMGKRGAQHFLGVVLIGIALLSSFGAGIAGVPAVRRPVKAAPPAPI